MTNLERHLKDPCGEFQLLQAFLALTHDARDALANLPKWEQWFHVFWLFGPFILLIERTPADAWVTIIAITFCFRSVLKRDGSWLKIFWVQAGFAFWFWCLFSSAFSENSTYSMGEAFVWFRFPLFAMATVFWLALDKRLIYAMLLSISLGTLIMCFILSAELLLVGPQGGRLSWPYGDLVSGNYLAKAGLPAFIISVALAVSIRGKLAAFAGIFGIFSIVISIFCGERINFLIRACAGMLAGLAWKPNWFRYITLILVEFIAILLTFATAPDAAKRFTEKFILGATNFESSVWLHTINGGIVIAKENLIIGIGPGNFRILSKQLLEGIQYTRADNHPHNYYVQIMCETGVIGLFLGTVFLWSIIWSCFRQSLQNRENVVIATAWVVPFGFFWPIATSADFFGQWNNIFMWSSVALALSCRADHHTA